MSQLAEVGDEAADLQHHLVGGEEGVELVGRVHEGRGAPSDAGEDPLSSLGQVLGAALPLFHELLLSALEDLVDFLALDGEVFDESVEIRKAALELLELDHQACQLLIALLGRVAHRQRARDALAEQR